MTGTLTTHDGSPDPGRVVHRITWRFRAFVLAGLAFAAVYTTTALALGVGANHIGLLWIAAIAWTVLAGFAGALWRGFRHHDWSAFSRYELPEDDGEMDEWLSRTGRYASLRDMEEELLHDNDHLR